MSYLESSLDKVALLLTDGLMPMITGVELGLSREDFAVLIDRRAEAIAGLFQAGDVAA